MRLRVAFASLALLAAFAGTARGQIVIDPAMTRAQVLEKLGSPFLERTVDGSTFLFYRNGSELLVGMHDVVILENNRVVDAVFRSDARRYSGASSSPRAIAPDVARRQSPTPPGITIQSAPTTSGPQRAAAQEVGTGRLPMGNDVDAGGVVSPSQPPGAASAVPAAPAETQPKAPAPSGTPVAPPVVRGMVARAVPTASAITTAGDITIDGHLTDAEWGMAPVATDFVQSEPVEGAPATERTEVRLAVDAQAVYVGARLFDSRPSTIARQLVRRDEYGQYDYFEVSFDPNRDRRTGYRFRVSADNIQGDQYLFNDRDNDEAWDAVWASAVQRDSLGWTVEMRIPLSQMRYTASGSEQTWGVNFVRRILRTNEELHFALISRLQQGSVSQFAPLAGVRIPKASRRLELRPYVLGQASRLPVEAGNPFRDGSAQSAQAGVDMRYGLGAQFNLDVTLNPDFGQVEADPAVINLTAFETFLEERRPFFVQDAKLLDFGGGGGGGFGGGGGGPGGGGRGGGPGRLFYSRRVGRAPRGSAPDSASFSDIPQAARLLGAAKLTGRSASGLSVGSFVARTRQETGQTYYTARGATQSLVVEPATNYGVLRLRQDLNHGASSIGALGTVLMRELPSDRSLNFLSRTALSGGIDWEHQWRQRAWAFFGFVAASHLQGDSTAMISVQRSSNHFFQRPDMPRFRLDSTATSLSGFEWRATLERRRGTHWTGAVWMAHISPGYEINDMGFSGRQENYLDSGMRLVYREIQPGRLMRSYNVFFSTFHNWSSDLLSDPRSAAAWNRAHVAANFNLSFFGQFLNFWRTDANLSVRPQIMDRTATRGGPLMLSPSAVSARFGVRTDQRRALSIGPNFSYEKRSMGAGQQLDAGVEVEYRPSSAVQLSFRPGWTRTTEGAQYVDVTRALPFAPTFGKRYLFATLERRELSLETRMNVVFSPRLSLQIYAQPLLSAGDYTSYKQLLAPSTYAFDVLAPGTAQQTGATVRCSGGRTCVDAANVRHVDFDGNGTSDYSFDDRNFNVRSLIGNAVLRWEYRPGSTLFVVWQRHQSEEVSSGRFDFRHDLNALARVPAENILMVKVAYWLGL